MEHEPSTSTVTLHSAVYRSTSPPRCVVMDNASLDEMRVDCQLPRFNGRDPRRWFWEVEAIFMDKNIEEQASKLYHVVHVLPVQLCGPVYDLMYPEVIEENVYDILRTEVIAECVRRTLGAQTYQLSPLDEGMTELMKWSPGVEKVLQQSPMIPEPVRLSLGVLNQPTPQSPMPGSGGQSPGVQRGHPPRNQPPGRAGQAQRPSQPSQQSVIPPHVKWTPEHQRVNPSRRTQIPARMSQPTSHNAVISVRVARQSTPHLNHPSTNTVTPVQAHPQKVNPPQPKSTSTPGRVGQPQTSQPADPMGNFLKRKYDRISPAAYSVKKEPKLFDPTIKRPRISVGK